MKLWFFGPVIATLLVVGGVEVTPSPFSVKGEAEIFKFIRKTGGRDLEVRGFMEKMEKSLTDMNEHKNHVVERRYGRG
jgi:hypothetical protein